MADLVGKQIGSYYITRRVAMGAFASTYLGEHILTKRQVAIEIFPDQQTVEDLASFRAKSQLTSQLRHPHILQTLDFGLEGSTPFIVTDYAPNGSLRQRHPRGSKVPIATVTSYVKQVAEALQYAHDLKLIHRDVKPENLLLGRNDEVLLADFGIAVAALSSQSLDSRVAGTAIYMAPEQLQGKPVPASDQYALGVDVYEWLSGSPPFSGSIVELVNKHMFAPPPPLRERGSTVSTQVEAVVMKALAKDPQQRFASVKEFAEALERAYLSSAHRTKSVEALPTTAGPIYTAGEEDLPTMSISLDAAAKEQSYRTREDETMAAAIADEDLFMESMETDIVALGPTIAVPGTSWKGKDTDIKALTPAEGASSHDTTSTLSLFAIARATLEDDNRAFVGKVYIVQTGIAQSKPEGFAGEPFKLPLRSNIRFLFLDILLHTSSNIQLISHWHRRLRYDSQSLEPHLVGFKFRVSGLGKCSLSLDYYYERRWLRTIHIRFDAVEQLELTAAFRED